MNTKKLLLGTFLLISFAVVLVIIFMPIFGNGKNGLEFSDNFFNSLAKGSSNFMTEMREVAHPFAGSTFEAEISLDNPEQAKMAETLFTQAGAQVEVAGPKLRKACLEIRQGLSGWKFFIMLNFIQLKLTANSLNIRKEPRFFDACSSCAEIRCQDTRTYTTNGPDK